MASASAASRTIGGVTRSGLLALIIGIALPGAVIAVFSAAMRSFDHNEGLYVTAGWLVAHGHVLYREFSFWQMPYAAWSYAAVFWLLNPSHFLLTAKLTTFVFWLGSLGIVAAVAWRLTRRAALSAGVTLLFALNPCVVRCAVEASNYMQPIMCALAGYACALHAWQVPRHARCAWFGAGVCNAAAIGFKLYYLPVVAAYIAVILTTREEGAVGRHRWAAIAPFGAGLILGLTPVVISAIRDPSAFWFNNLAVHQLTTAWWSGIRAEWHAQGRQFLIPLGLGAKFRFAFELLAQPGNTVVLVLLTAMVVANCVRPSAPVPPATRLAAALAIISTAAAFAPTPMWPQYWGLPVPFYFLWMVSVFARSTESRRPVEWLLLGALLVVLFVDGRTLARNVRLVARTEYWPALNLARDARQIAAAAEARGHHGSVLALAQMWAVESRWSTPEPELAYAPFTFVIADAISPERRRRFHLVGPSDLPRLCAEHPPAVVLAGLYEDSFWTDRSLAEWAQEHGFSSDTAIGPARVFLPH